MKSLLPLRMTTSAGRAEELRRLLGVMGVVLLLLLLAPLPMGGSPSMNCRTCRRTCHVLRSFPAQMAGYAVKWGDYHASGMNEARGWASATWQGFGVWTRGSWCKALPRYLGVDGVDALACVATVH